MIPFFRKIKKDIDGDLKKGVPTFGWYGGSSKKGKVMQLGAKHFNQRNNTDAYFV